MNTDRIKRRIRALLNVTGENGAADGEIENAMRMVAALMQEHQLTEADLEAEAKTAGRCGACKMGTADAVPGAKRLSTWEAILANAISILVGSVRHFTTTHAVAGASVFRSQERTVLRFYGPAEDAQLASELFDEWRNVIGTMAQGKYGGIWRGDGAMYACGFAESLHAKASTIAKERQSVNTASTRALVRVETGSLACFLNARREQAAKWLREEQGVNLTPTPRRRGYRAGSEDAYENGAEDGHRAEFEAKRKHKIA